MLFSTRSASKSEDTRKRLGLHFQRTLRKANGTTLGISLLLEKRVKLEGVQVDLLKLTTCKALAEQLLNRGQELDAVIWNAGIPGWSGLNWPKAILDILTGVVHESTYPTYPICIVGAEAKPQLPERKEEGKEPVLGEVFTANVFGHYMLTHYLTPLFHADSRIIWIGSISAVAETFTANDIQGLRASMAYESSKRVTDYLVLTSDLPSTQPYIQNFLPSSGNARPRMYVAHPGVIGTSIASLHWILEAAMFAFFYLARWLGSPWHCVEPYKGAVSAVYAALSPAEQLPATEKREGKGKWGSAVSVYGDERVARTETEGWGFGGEMDVAAAPGGIASTWKRRQKMTKESREEFEVVGRGVWKEMEEMRVEWERRLGPIDRKASVDM